MKVGILIVGIHGASASTFVAGYLQQKHDKDSFKLGSYWCSLTEDFPSPIYDLKIGGWDYRFNNFTEALDVNGIVKCDIDSSVITYYKPILGPNDYGVMVEGKQVSHNSLKDAVSSISENIKDFRNKYQLDRIIVINASSPKYCNEGLKNGWSSNQAYSLGAVSEGADWVEFTPSDSINEELIKLAIEKHSRLAGRDGSTGQTILKIYLRDFFKLRGLEIKSWYSTNLIGNHDGEVLKNSDFNKTKFQDKLNALPKDNFGDTTHIVEIQFIPPAGDNKESWDCIHFLGWLQSNMSLRINWHGKDSFLAAVLMFDIIAGLIHAESKEVPYGLIPTLGLFFKNPVGRTNPSFEELFNDFRDFVMT